MGVFLLIIFLITIALVGAIEIIHKENIERNLILIFSIIYNFIMGFCSWIIFFSVIFLWLMFFGEMKSTPLLWGVCIIIIFLTFIILILPLNIKMKKKLNISIIKYIILSIIVFILGFALFLILANLGILNI